ncbi:methyltransferase domain-containing protein [Microbacterium sp.]|uniref:methyltransferase domain-containing protein n=1 Tax=Microbacterium sp. TaxID=51671 RepID=UPI0039C9E865
MNPSTGPLPWSARFNRDPPQTRVANLFEVGSGGGGGAFYISRYLEPRSMTGMDFSQEAVDLCNRHRRVRPSLEFVCGDAPADAIPGRFFRRRDQRRVLTLLGISRRVPCAARQEPLPNLTPG